VVKFNFTNSENIGKPFSAERLITISNFNIQGTKAPLPIFRRSYQSQYSEQGKPVDDEILLGFAQTMYEIF